MSLDVYLERKQWVGVFSDNITHNLNTMADKAGIYKHLWRPDKVGMIHAVDLIEPLQSGLHKLLVDPEKYKKYDAENGWGVYSHLVNFVDNYLQACMENPDARVRVWR